MRWPRQADPAPCPVLDKYRAEVILDPWMSWAQTIWVGMAAVGLASILTVPRDAEAGNGSSLVAPLEVGLAFVTNLAVHEFGHVLVAEGVGADKATFKFFGEEDGSFFLGLSTATGVPDESVLPYRLGGEIAASYTFELALQSFRRTPTTYNRALLFFSGTDFFWYTLYAFYLAPREDERYDPVGIRESTGFSRGAILAAATAQLATNAWRIVSGTDAVAPSFSYDRQEAVLNFTFRF